jgi:hypothetical protein
MVTKPENEKGVPLEMKSDDNCGLGHSILDRELVD